MLSFSASEPFPLTEGGSHTYHEAQSHSEQADAWLGLQTSFIEGQLATLGCRKKAVGAHGERQELWIGLAVCRLLTPYTEIRSILHRLSPKPDQTIIDLGAGYGRMGFVIGRHYPGVRFIGYEYVGERVAEANRCLSQYHFPLVRMEHADLSSKTFKLPAAEYYFIYDFGTVQAIEKILFDLKKTAQGRTIIVIGRGRSCRDSIERKHPWLSQVFAPEHHGNFSIYFSGAKEMSCFG